MTNTTKTTIRGFKGTLVPLLLGALASVIACSTEADLYGLSCPCAGGFVCCEEDNVCVTDIESQCTSASTKKASSSGGASNGGASMADANQVALARNESPRCMTQDDRFLYWMNADGLLSAVSKDGGAVIRSLFAPPAQPTPSCGLVVEGGAIYATMYGLGSVAKLSLSTSPEVKIGEQSVMFGALLTPSSIAIDESYIYVTELDSGSIRRIAKDASTEDAGAPSANDGVLGRAGNKPHDIVADGDSLYWLDEGGLRKMPKAGGHIVTLADTRGPSRGLTLVDHQLVWSDEKDIWLMPLPSGAPRKLILLSDASPSSVESSRIVMAGSLGVVTTDGHDVFFAWDAFVFRTSIAGGAAAKVFRYYGAAEGEANDALVARDLRADATRLYWFDATTIWARPRQP